MLDPGRGSFSRARPSHADHPSEPGAIDHGVIQNDLPRIAGRVEAGRNIDERPIRVGAGERQRLIQIRECVQHIEPGRKLLVQRVVLQQRAADFLKPCGACIGMDRPLNLFGSRRRVRTGLSAADDDLRLRSGLLRRSRLTTKRRHRQTNTTELPNDPVKIRDHSCHYRRAGESVEGAVAGESP